MLKVRYHKSLIRMMDVFGSEQVTHEPNVDVIISSKVHLPSIQKEIIKAEKGVLHCYARTVVIHLKKSEDKLFSEIHKQARYQINRALKRDPITYHHISSPTDEQIQDFVTFFDQFAKYKNLPAANFGRLKALRDQNALMITFVKDQESNVLCYHVYLLNENYSSMYYSASARFDNSNIKNLIGRANRFLHWNDILLFKEKGLEWYDLGGLLVTNGDEQEPHLNKFKQEFGGQIVDLDRKFHPLTIRGKIVVLLYKFKMRKRPEFIRAKTLKNTTHIPG